ncbi:MAG TPA: plastocyanin/azurin family copper-binding protein [Solirubrobacterales bacterium]|nr:plastocyanin/azurin family copper-binding protein [Solirubrobacterales bacterium]
MATALAVTALAACGSSDDEAQQLSFTVDSKGKVSGPSSAESGLAEVTLANDGKSEADLQLIRTEGEHSAEEVADAFGTVTQGKAFPDWFFGGGGVGSTASGEETSVTQVLQPGTYYAVNTEGPFDPEAAATLEVTGEESDEVVEGDVTVTAGEYAFSSEEPLPSGANEIVFDNIGAQPHHLLASKLEGDATAEDALRFFKTEKGKPPLSEEGTQATAVIEGGEAQKVTLDLEPGRYAFYCFIADREGGPPHAIKGMVSEIEVE